MIDYFKRMFAYDAWANGEVLASLESLREPPAACIRLLGHILSAERLWLERLSAQTPSLAVWPEFTLEGCKRQEEEIPGLWQEYLSSLPEGSLQEAATYKNSKGENWTNCREDVLTHVIMHSAYHRGQIASQMRQAGLTPAYTDFIHAVRQGFVK